MAKKEEENEPKEWTPDQAIPDEEGEDAAQKRFVLERRVKWLHEDAEKKGKKPTVKKSGWLG